jgi:hypothetical protein
MNICFLSGVCVLGAITLLRAQDLGADGRVFVQLNAFAQVLGQSVPDAAAPNEGFPFNQVVRGKPFSATEERRTLQILRDGTRIDNGEKSRLFRDSHGRTRMEEMSGAVTIFDPVAGFRTQLDRSTKMARREIPGTVPPLIIDTLKTQPNLKASKGVASETTVSLKPQVVNGVMTQGTRTTMIIPKGQIGNDREIKVVTERWISNDLQMLIKSTNTDPRYGETTYQLTGVLQNEPDPLLFQIPTDYTIITEGGRGGRNGAPAGGRSTVPGGRNGGPAVRLKPPGGGGGRSPDPQGTK